MKKIQGSNLTDETIDIKDTQLCINRPAYNKKTFDSNYAPSSEYPNFQLANYVKEKLQICYKWDRPSIKKQVYNRIPAIKWLKNYNVREFLFNDCIAGLTVGIMHIPYGKKN